MARQLMIGGSAGPPPEIPAGDFVTSKRSKPGANGYVIISESLLRVCPWGAWDAAHRSNSRLSVSRDRGGNRVVIRLDPSGGRVFGKMPGWISADEMVGGLLEDGMVPGRHPARWEKEDAGWALVIYPKVIRRQSSP